MAALPPADEALIGLLDHLDREGYEFITPTPATHRLVAERRNCASCGSLRDVFGWSLPFRPGEFPPELIALIDAAGALEAAGEMFRSTLRVSTVDGRLHLHSSPSRDRDSVFLGPDSYRFVRLLREELERRPGFDRAADIGVGAGVGALMLASRNPTAEVFGTDINERALRLFAANARHAALPVRSVKSSGLDGLTDAFDLIVTNPPYIAGQGERIYRDGGRTGVELGLSWVRTAADRLAPQGRIILYTGSPIVQGRDSVRGALEDLAHSRGLGLRYEEIDPDVFGGTLRQTAYREVERLAAVGAVLTAP